MAPRFSGTPQEAPKAKPRFSGKPFNPRGATSIDDILARGDAPTGKEPSLVESIMDTVGGTGAGAANLAVDTIATPVDILQMIKQAEDRSAIGRDDSQWYNRPLTELLFSPEANQSIKSAREGLFDTTAEVRKTVDEGVYQPKYGPGKFAKKAIPWLAPPIAAPGKAARVKQGGERLFQIAGDVIAQGALPMAAYEGVKQYVGNDVAAMLAALMTGVGVSAGRSVKSPEAVTARDYRGTTDRTWDDMGRLQDEQRALGLEITPAEAHAQITGQMQSGPLQTQRYLEATPIGQLRSGPMLANRGNQVEQGLNTVLDQIAPRSSDPHTIGPQVTEGAENVIRATEGQRTAAEQPAYRRADPTDVDPQELDAFIADLDTEIAQYTPENTQRKVLEEFRKQFVQKSAQPDLPDGTPGTPEQLAYDRRNLDSIKKDFREATKQGQVGVQGIKANVKGILGRHLDRLDNILKEEGAATPSQGALDYREGVDTHANFTDFILDPLKQGPVGDFSRAKTTEAVGNVMLPPKPTANDVPAMVEALTRIGQETTALPAAARQHIDQMFMDLGGKTRSANREWVGADLAKNLAGSPAQRARTRTVLETVGAPGAAADLDRRIEGWQATGKRLPPNSATAQNLQRSAELQQTLPGDAMSAGLSGKLSSLFDGLYRAWALSSGQKKSSEYTFGDVGTTRGAAATDWMDVIPEAINRTGLSTLYEYLTSRDEQRR